MVKLVWKKKAHSVFVKLDSSTRHQIADKLKEVVEKAEEYPHRPLRGNLAGYFRLRISIYRIIYTYDENLLTVQSVQRRDKAYN